MAWVDVMTAVVIGIPDSGSGFARILRMLGINCRKRMRAIKGFFHSDRTGANYRSTKPRGDEPM